MYIFSHGFCSVRQEIESTYISSVVTATKHIKAMNDVFEERHLELISLHYFGTRGQVKSSLKKILTAQNQLFDTLSSFWYCKRYLQGWHTAINRRDEYK